MRRGWSTNGFRRLSCSWKGPWVRVELGSDYWIRTTTESGTFACRYPPPRYAWADPAYDTVHASIVACHADLLAALQGVKSAETTAEDNLKTLDLVFAAYESARTGQVVEVAR